MDERERLIVKTFIIRGKRPRYFYCLDDEKGRRSKLDKLNHCNDLDPRFVEWLPKKSDVLSMLRESGSPEEAYVMSFAEEIDGKTLPLEDAVRQTIWYAWGTIVSCIPGKLAFYYDEDGLRRAILRR